jgi:uroporphyrinogen-III synthase
MKRLFVLRPEPGASETAARACEAGLDAVVMPLFKVEPIAWQPPDAAGFDALLLTSANAVRHGGDGLQALRGLPVHAVGAATAQAAREAGFGIASSGNSGVERLLGSIDPELRLLHLCGEDRHETHERQAITAMPVYRSAELAAPDGLARINGQVAAVHSPRAGSRLRAAIDEAGVAASSVSIAAISTAAGEAAGDGWARCEAADEPNDPALLALAARLCGAPEPR